MEPNKMTEVAEIDDRRAVARRLFDALCARFPDKYVALIQPPDVTDDRLPAPNLIAANTAAKPSRRRRIVGSS
jgi:hypothetical protein